MRRILAIGVVVLFTAASAKAATITGKLVDLSASNTTPGSVHTIEILLSSSTPNGVASAEVEVVSAGTGNANYGTQSGATAANSSTFVASIGGDGYGTAKPSLSTDGSGDTSLWQPKPVVGGVPDGDFDAVGLAIFSTPGSVDSDPADSAAYGLTNGFEELATEKWVFNASETLNMYISSPTYFADASGGSDAASPAYDTVAATGVSVNIVSVPEPASMMLLGLGGLGLAAVARRRRS